MTFPNHFGLCDCCVREIRVHCNSFRRSRRIYIRTVFSISASIPLFDEYLPCLQCIRNSVKCLVLMLNWFYITFSYLRWLFIMWSNFALYSSRCFFVDWLHVFINLMFQYLLVNCQMWWKSTFISFLFLFSLLWSINLNTT